MCAGAVRRRKYWRDAAWALAARLQNFNVEEWFEGDRYERLAICRGLALARLAFKLAMRRSQPAGS
jgi:hypothetical protein